MRRLVLFALLLLIYHQSVDASMRFRGRTIRDVVRESNSSSVFTETWPCAGSSNDEEITFNRDEGCDGEPELKWDYTNNRLGVGDSTDPDELVHLNGATDGDQVLLLLENSQANSVGSSNETAIINFAFGGINDVARITAGKVASYTSTNAEDSRMLFHIDDNGALQEIVRLGVEGLAINSTVDPGNALDVKGAAAIGVAAGSTVNAPSNGLYVGGDVGIGTTSPTDDLTIVRTTAAVFGIEGNDSFDNPSRIVLRDDVNTGDPASINWIDQATGTPPHGPSLALTIDSTIKGYVFIDNEDVTGVSGEDFAFVSSGADAGGLTGQTMTLSSGVTIATQRHNAFFAPVINGVAGGATETITNAATVYIDAAPSGSDITFTNGPYALWVDDGAVRFDGVVIGDIEFEDDSPKLCFRDTSDDTAYCLHLDTADLQWGDFQFWKGTDTGSGFNVSPDVPIWYVDETSNAMVFPRTVEVSARGTAAGFKADADGGGCLMLRDTDDAGWTECVALDGSLTCSIDADGVCDGA